MAASPLRIVGLCTLSPGLGRWGFGWEQRTDGQQRATHLTTGARELFPKPAIAIPVGQIPGRLYYREMVGSAVALALVRLQSYETLTILHRSCSLCMAASKASKRFDKSHVSTSLV
jgi:hypothetical protein